MSLLFRLAVILLLAAAASAAWLFRREIRQYTRPQVARVTEALGVEAAGLPGRAALTTAQDKIDSLHGWNADSVVLTASEVASLLDRGLPAEARPHLDSLELQLGEGRITVRARLETARLPAELLGPLAGALDPWERVAITGPVTLRGPGKGLWQVDVLGLRGFALPVEASRRLVRAGMPGTTDGVIPLALPEGVRALRIHPGGVVLYPKERR